MKDNYFYFTGKGEIQGWCEGGRKGQLPTKRGNIMLEWEIFKKPAAGENRLGWRTVEIPTKRRQTIDRERGERKVTERRRTNERQSASHLQKYLDL